MVDVRDSCHGDKGEVVQDPAEDGVDAAVVDLVDFGFFELVVAALPADEVPCYQCTEGEQAGGAAPVD